ncbi:hypothetical protein [Vibrio parahaemolyticus]|nr:hypothetical protein [Vibrio parahaemolyticus]EJG0938438.1 hypothetical protein [Vibrio parahaemolyticus O1]EGQ7810589.1 hypothetical protein [Vibrio parahaemolyticus]EGQ7811188.1 hypothetical protein [Vibrio parahaemolyticus]EGQ8180917.1 hypothetical protein [Vibrio parahaemolyticus]EGQ8181902.1 hypothetical protein [Vibrio parahaemolyticus]
MSKLKMFAWGALAFLLVTAAFFFHYIEKESAIPVIHEFHLEESSE